MQNEERTGTTSNTEKTVPQPQENFSAHQRVLAHQPDGEMINGAVVQQLPHFVGLQLPRDPQNG